MLSTELLKGQITPRRYQETIFAKATLANTLVVLPTGLGKTMIAVMLAVHRLAQYPQSKVLILAPTKPLVQQHEKTFRKYIDLPEDKFVLFTGAVSPEMRSKQWDAAQVIFATPQVIENDALGGKLSLADVCLMVVDEAHRTVGDYSYVFLAQQYIKQAERQRILGLTASPGTDNESITEVCRNLAIEEIEVRSERDSDVSPYVQDIDVTWVKVDLPAEFSEVQKLLKACYNERLEQVRALGAIQGPISMVNKRTLLMLQGELQGRIARGERDFEAMKAMSVAAEALKILHAVDLLETQGLSALTRYMESLSEAARNGQSKAVVNVVSDVQWKTAQVKVAQLISKDIEHPKLRELRRIVLQETHAQPDIKIIIFNSYRDQAVKIKESLDELDVSAKIFVGQAKKGETGMSQKAQKAILEEFSTGGFRCLIATSVAEEGLDIPKVDLVLFYEPIPSAIRTVQRRGRTGRGEKGKVIVLMTQGTPDAVYKWVAHHKEKRMYRAIAEVKKTFKTGTPLVEAKAQKTLLQSYYEDKKAKQQETLSSIKVVCDHREKASPVMKALLDAGVQLELKQLSIGDYQVSDRVVVEYKLVTDFVDSMLDGRLMSQLKELKNYPRPVILVEGDADIYSLRRVHPNAIQGMLATIAVSFNIPILWSKTPRESAGLLVALARREQVGGQDFQYHSAKPLTDDEMMEFIVAAFPGIGSQLARPLLAEFKSVKNLVNASEEELRKVPLIGEKKAKRIKELSEREYQGGKS
ncbi:TPA: DEAD/DEAH box helicase [Candidatus Woesearchaeota archaeon]|nr:DEAD/DEAH box helicase [Candidatus Woesearchaeota archaeon]